MPDNARIKQLRPPKKEVDPEIPYLFLHEQETGSDGRLHEVNTIFLTNRECPFRCLMCDLWKQTLDRTTPAGAVPRQIDYALDRLPEASVVKLYNSGNFFDKKAIPEEDYPAIAERLQCFDRVIVENHPRLCNRSCLDFQAMLNGSLEIAIGLETIHPEVLPALNKQITTEDYIRATSFLTENGIGVRTFLLLNPPYLTEREASIEWTLRSAEFAFRHGSYCCSIIPTRPGNGIMEELQEQGDYIPPELDALEEAFERVLGLDSGRVFVDLWDLERFSTCPSCYEERKTRLERMNLDQEVKPPVACPYCCDQQTSNGSHQTS